MITNKPLDGEKITNDGIATRLFQSFFDEIERFANLFQTQSYTVATVPDAAKRPRGIIYVSDETGGATLAFSDGTNWRRVQDRAIIS